jgi:DNA-binding beta-propeller fold protein YncE
VLFFWREEMFRSKNKKCRPALLNILMAVLISLVLSSGAFALDPTAYVLNTNGETLSKINLTTGVVTNNFLTIGSDIWCYPNQMVVRDTIMFVTVSGTDEIQMINLKTEKTVKFINTGAYTNPYWIDFGESPYLYATLLLTGTVAKIDYSTGTIVSDVPVGKSPEGIKVMGDKAYIACSGFDMNTYQYDSGRVAVYDITGDSVLKYINVGLNPQYLQLDNSGWIHVVCTGDYATTWGSVYIIDTDFDTAVDSIYFGGTPGQISIGPDNIGYIASAGWTESGYVFTYNTSTGQVYHDSGNPLTVDLNCLTAIAYQDSSCFTGSFTNYVNVIDSGGGNLARYAVGDGPVHIAFNYLPGDVNGDFVVNIFDITHLVDWLYLDGDQPRWPKWRANVNNDRLYNIFDITYLISYLYLTGPPPQTGPDWLL